MPALTRNPPPKLLEEVRQVLRLHHYSMHTERSSVEWIVRFVRFHGMRSREDLFPAEPTIESLLTDLVVHGYVAAATQNQAMNALVCLYTRVLNHSLQDNINAVRADKQINVPARDISVDPRAGVMRRHHMDPSVSTRPSRWPSAVPV